MNEENPKRSELEGLGRIPWEGVFALEAVPKFFEWIRWSLSLALLDYAVKLSGSTWLDWVFQLGVVLLGLYYLAYFRKLLYERGGLFKRMPRLNDSLSVIVAILLATVTYFTVLKLVGAASLLQK